MLEFAVFIVGGLATFFLTRRYYQSELREIQQTLRLKDANWKGAENRYLNTLRRELANKLVSSDSKRFRRIYTKLREYEETIRNGSDDDAKLEFQYLIKKYPYHSSFDLLGTRDFIPYSEAFKDCHEDDVAERYSDIVKFLILDAHLDRSHGHRPEVTSETEYAILVERLEESFSPLGEKVARRAG